MNPITWNGFIEIEDAGGINGVLIDALTIGACKPYGDVRLRS